LFILIEDSTFNGSSRHPNRFSIAEVNMSDDSTTTSILTPNRQLKELSRQVLSIRAQLRDSRSIIPDESLHRLNNLAVHLDNISKQVERHEAERKDLRALADIGRIVNSSLELHDVLRVVMDTIIRLTGAERGFLMLKDKSGELSIRIARNWEQESIESSEFEISRTVINRVTEKCQPIVTTNAQEDPRFGGQASVIAYHLRSILCVPLKVKAELTGVIYADNRIRTGNFTESDRDLLAAFANQAAVAIENAQLFESVTHTLAEVTELKNMMDNIFASIASGVITADIEYQILLCNRAAEAMLYQTEGDLVGKKIQECLPPIANEINKSVTHVRDTGQAILGLEISTNIPDRGAVDFRFNISPLMDATESTQGVAIVLDDLTEQKRLEAQHRLFEKMVSPAVINQINPNAIQLGGERGMITTLFADVRGYTSFSENIVPEQLVSILNQYLAAATESILAQEGTIDKFMGDAVMAWFNAPIPQTDHTLRAVSAALGMNTAIKELHKKLPLEFQLGFGVGIHYGPAVLGLVGTESRMDYTAIGDSVNSAKRIQENAAPGKILISEDAYQFVQHKIVVKKVDPIQAKGKSQPIEVFEIVGLNREVS
jgi:PAS domain S-box-containing protein